MKRLFARLTIIAGIAAMLLAPSIQAADNLKVLRVKVPFSFIVPVPVSTALSTKEIKP